MNNTIDGNRLNRFGSEHALEPQLRPHTSFGEDLHPQRMNLDAPVIIGLAIKELDTSDLAEGPAILRPRRERKKWPAVYWV